MSTLQHVSLEAKTMNAIQYVSNEYGKTTSVIVPIELWQEMIKEDDIREPRTITLSDRDRDLFLAVLESPPPANAKLKASMRQYLARFHHDG
jgi:hypothetical protein